MQREKTPTNLHPPSMHPPIPRRAVGASDPPGSGKNLTPSFAGGAGTPDQVVTSLPASPVPDTCLQTLNELKINCYNYGRAQ